MTIYSFKSKVGTVTLVSKNNKIIKIVLNTEETYHDEPDKACLLAEKEILEYFENLRTEFTFPVNIEGSLFMKSVLKTMMKIPYGETWSYSKLAKASGNEKAVRAVGTACKNNPLPLIVPCHRVIKKTGEIGNFNGGVDLKQYLLNIEKKPSKI